MILVILAIIVIIVILVIIVIVIVTVVISSCPSDGSLRLRVGIARCMWGFGYKFTNYNLRKTLDYVK